MPWKGLVFDMAWVEVINKFSSITREEWAYIAGIIDGEGTIGIYSRSRQHKGSRQVTSSRSYRPRLAVVNTNIQLIMWLNEKLGGRVDIKSKVVGNKTVMVWSMLDVISIFEICKNIIPYLIIKKDQANLVLEFPFDVRCNQYTIGLTKKIESKKEELYQRTLEMNRRGA